MTSRADTDTSSAGRRKPFLIGLTGGIASGKTAVSDIFAALGVPVVDTDVIAREVVAPGSEALAEIRHRFGDAVIGIDGGLDRRRMRELVFSDPALRRALEAIVHPRIRTETLARAAAAQGPYVIIVVPLLVESGFDALVDAVVVVDCPETVQLERLMARDHHDPTEARRMLDSQTDRQTRLAKADHVISNTGSLAETRLQVQRLHEQLLAEAHRRRNSR